MTAMIQKLSSLYGDLRGYGRGRIRAKAVSNTRLSADELNVRSRTLFQARVHAAMVRFPVYAEAVRRHCGGIPEPGDVVEPHALPVWTRLDQRNLFAALSGPPVPGAFVHATGGSTGEPTRFYMTRESYEWRMAIADRGYSWAGAEEGRRSYYVWGTPIKPLSPVKKLKVEFQHVLQRREYFDSFIFNDERKAACCWEINRFKPKALVGYAGNLVDLALYVRANYGNKNIEQKEAKETKGRDLLSAGGGGIKYSSSFPLFPSVQESSSESVQLTWKARTLVTGAEGLQPGQRELLQETLADEVFMSYGSREFMLIGMECSQHRGYHISSDNLYVEVVDEQGQPVAPGETGRILVTDLRNDANPFIRYEIGDMGSMAAEPCSCGLPFPLLARVEGRIQEYLLAIDGSRLTALFIPHLIKEFAWVLGYQIEQEQPGKVTVNVLADHEPTLLETVPLVAALQAKLGEGSQVEVVRVAALKKGASGKVSIVVKKDGPV